jgi:hypothetical protein
MDLENIPDATLKEELSRRRFFQTAVYFAHSILCTADHNTACNFYTEQQMVEEWELPDHLKWIERTNELLESYQCTPANLVMALPKVNDVIDKIGRLTDLEQRILQDLLPVLIRLP